MTEYDTLKSRVGPITSLFVTKEAAASCAIDRHEEGQTMPWPPRSDSFDAGPGGQVTCYDEAAEAAGRRAQMAQDEREDEQR